MPARRAIFRVDVEGAEVLAARLAPDALYRRPVGGLLTEATLLAHRIAARRVPQRRGTLAGSLRHELHATATPAYGLVLAGAVNRGFRYGFALDRGARYHYWRNGRPGRRATKGWLSKVPAAVRRALGGMLRTAEAAVERGLRG